LNKIFVEKKFIIYNVEKFNGSTGPIQGTFTLNITIFKSKTQWTWHICWVEKKYS